jgi:hypothetical protein
MNSAFIVQHLYFLPDEQEDVKWTGIYRSLESARAGVERLRDKPGFRDFPRLLDPLKEDDIQRFYIDELPLDCEKYLT